MKNNRGTRDTVQSVVRAFDVLQAFSVERPVLGVSEIASSVQLNRTTVHRLLTTLEACGVVRRDAGTQKYMVGSLVLKLSNVFLQQSDIRTAGLPVITRLRDETGQTAALHIRQEHFRITVAQAESRQDLRVTYPDLGELIPLHLGAPGKVILAHLPDQEIEQYLQEVPLTAATEFSPNDRDELHASLAQPRTEGYVVTSQERRSGVVSIAAPIRHATGAVVASVNISAPIQRITESQIQTFIPLVVKAGDEISRSLGHQAH